MVTVHGCQLQVVRYNGSVTMTTQPAIQRTFFARAVVFFLVALPLSALSSGSLAGTPPAAASGLIEIAELLAHPELYDHQDVVVTGKVMNVQLATNRQGQPAYGFLLQDQAGTLKEVSLGQLEVHEGDQVIVEGVFSRLRQVGRTSIYNEIKALSVKPLTRFNPDFVG